MFWWMLTMEEDEEIENYGINIEFAHLNAKNLIKDDFFWCNVDELSPFGSDEGDTALEEFRDWRKENPNDPVLNCIEWIIKDIGAISIGKYNKDLLLPDLIKSQINNKDFDDQYYIFTLDISIIATGFGQYVDEGIIDNEVIPYLRLAIHRQKLWAKGMVNDRIYINNLNRLDYFLNKI